MHNGRLPTHSGHSRHASSGSATDALGAILSSALATPRRSSTPTPNKAKTRHYVIPFVVLFLIVFASATQTETASYFASHYGFDKPYFGFFVTHSTFALVFPIHFGLLVLFNRTPRTRGERAKQLLRNLRAVLADQLGTTPRWRQLTRPLMAKIIPLTALISFPAICWFVAMAFSPAMDITAIYATSAFFAYFFSLLLLGTRLTRLTLFAIAVAFAGVLVLTFAGAGKEADEGDKRTGTRRVIGDGIMVIGAILLGLYEVVYKMVLPESQGGATHAHNPADGITHYSAVAVDDDVGVESEAENDYALGTAAPQPQAHTPLLPKVSSRPASPVLGGLAGVVSPMHSRTHTPAHSRSHSASHSRAASHPPTPMRAPPHIVPRLPTAFHSNFLTSLIGVATFVLFWPPLPFLHFTGWETLEAPPSWGLMAVVAVGGSIYNAGLMILIGVWGPTTSSVANLLTIGVVAVFDAVWMGHVPDLQTIMGAVGIAAGFGLLLWEGEED
ncbi:hypothetical protein CspHIS471_0312970 [Cutaneotrichosporon sp. HIS471]|nr:hypothetical protein CspHIS471_0312970 [Cutaneotrichosporon sp. HIS471]